MGRFYNLTVQLLSSSPRELKSAEYLKTVSYFISLEHVKMKFIEIAARLKHIYLFVKHQYGVILLAGALEKDQEGN